MPGDAMTELSQIFNYETPLGPTAVDADVKIRALDATYDRDTSMYRQAHPRPPSFIVGRKGSGKTALLKSRRFDKDTVIVELGTSGTFSRVSTAIGLVAQVSPSTEEAVASLWEILLWGPVATRLVLAGRRPDDDLQAFRTVWEGTSELRRVAEATREHEQLDDLLLERMTQQVSEHVLGGSRFSATDTLGHHLMTRGVSWAEITAAARDLIRARGTGVFVLVDSIENLGEQLVRDDNVKKALRGLFHLVGRVGGGKYPFHLQCCFPSELWPLLHDYSANPVKDFSRKMVLQWHGGELVSAGDVRVAKFLSAHFPDIPEERRSISALLPAGIRNRRGRQERSIPYILRHTQLLPRQYIEILNEGIRLALARTGQPFMDGEDVTRAVAEIEAVLVPEIWAAHRFRYPDLPEVAERLIPLLPFRFTDAEFHVAVNRAGIKKRTQLDYTDVRNMLARVGMLGRYQREQADYINAVFEYTVEGQLNLGPDDTYCLHPLIVRAFSSMETVRPTGGSKPVYPEGTPLGPQDGVEAEG